MICCDEFMTNKEAIPFINSSAYQLFYYFISQYFLFVLSSIRLLVLFHAFFFTISLNLTLCSILRWFKYLYNLKILFCISSNSLTCPRTMMIERTDTILTTTAMLRPGRSIDITSFTISVAIRPCYRCTWRKYSLWNVRKIRKEKITFSIRKIITERKIIKKRITKKKSIDKKMRKGSGNSKVSSVKNVKKLGFKSNQ